MDRMESLQKDADLVRGRRRSASGRPRSRAAAAEGSHWERALWEGQGKTAKGTWKVWVDEDSPNDDKYVSPLIHSQTHRLTDSQTHRLTDSQTHRLTDSQTHRLTDSQTPAHHIYISSLS